MFRVAKCIILLLLCVSLRHCTRNPVSPTSASVRELTAAEKGLVDACNGFGLKLFKEVTEQGSGGNIFISPLSISMAFGMAYNGANGATEEAMRTTLELGDLTLEEVNESYRSVMELLSGLDSTVDFGMANSIWYREGWSFEEEFLHRCIEYFDALVSEMDFCDPSAPDIINHWVSENTAGKIEEIVDAPIDSETVMFLIDAIYFKGSWMYQFDPAHTEEDWFTLPDGSQKLCKMMEQRAEYRHLVNDEFEAVELPYGDGAFSMTIFLPHVGEEIASLISQFTQENWESWLENFSEDSLDVFIPKFTLEYELTLNNVLAELGMGIAFTPAADFTDMLSSGGIWIDRAKHKAFVEVNEEGTEAAAATSVVVVIGDPHDFGFRVNRPFVFVIHESHSGTILFIGKIMDPTEG